MGGGPSENGASVVAVSGSIRRYIMDKIKNVDKFWDFLFKAEALKQKIEAENIEETAEVRLIRGISFSELIRNNVPFHVIIPEEDKIKEKKMLFSISITSVEKSNDERAEQVIIKDSSGEDHACESSILKEIMGKDYQTLVLKIDPSTGKDLPSAEIVIPDLNLEQEPANNPIEEQKDDLEKVEEQAPKSKNRLPEFVKNGRFRDDALWKKELSTFLCNQHNITLTYQGNSGVIQFYVYPLDVKTEEKATDIFVIAVAGDVCRSAVSRGETSSVELDFEGIPFAVRGSFEGGTFKSMVKPLVEEIVSSYTEEIINYVPEKRTSTTFVQAEYAGITFNIFPGRFMTNAQNGFCPAGIVLIRNERLESLTPNQEGSFSIIGNNGENINIITYWMGGKDACFWYKMES